MTASNLLQKATQSTFYLYLLNLSLSRMIPFNAPHGFRITEITGDKVVVKLPFKRRNLNHIKGLHATALATLGEFTTGILLIHRLGMEKYRLILRRLEVDYFYQGKTDAIAEYELSDMWILHHVVNPLEDNDAVEVECEVLLHDIKGNHLATVTARWQIKKWEKVKTKN